MTQRAVRFFVGILLVGGAAGLFGVVAMSPRKFQKDFAAYYYASRAFARGGNPYDAWMTADTTGGVEPPRFVYPPHVLPLFAWSTVLSYSQARLTWLFIKGMFLAALLLFWHRILKQDKPDVLFYAFAAVAFNAALLTDLTTGNVAVIEQAFLWGAFLAFTNRRWLGFALLVAASAFFKVSNGLFLLLLMLSPDRKHPLAIAAGLAGILSPLVLSSVFRPGLFREFLTLADGLIHPGERGITNPCLWAFLADTRDAIALSTGWEIPSAAVELFFAAHALVVATLTVKILRRLPPAEWRERALYAVSLACLAFPLVVPRFKDYSFIQLIPPSYLLLRRPGSGRNEGALLVFILCAPTALMFRSLVPLSVYHLLFVNYGLWILMLLRGRHFDTEFQPAARLSDSPPPANA